MKHRSKGAANHFAVIDTTALASAVVAVASAPETGAPPADAATRPSASRRPAGRGRRTSSRSAASFAAPVLDLFRRVLLRLAGR